MSKLSRRDAIKAGLVTGAALVTPAIAMKTETNQKGPFKLKYAPHFGMFSNHAKDDLDQVRFAADEGFAAWEDNGMSGRGTDFHDKFARLMADKKMQMGIFVGHSLDWGNASLTTGNKDIQNKFVSDIKASTELAKRINAKWVTTVAGRVAQNLPMGHQIANVVEALRRAAEVCEPSGMVMVVEPLNWRDHPGMYGATSDMLRATCAAVNHPSMKILQDLYHLQVTEGNLIDNMNRSWEHIAYFQTGDNPGRNEPGTGEVNYLNVFKHIHSRGFTGILGMEHGNSKPGKEGERATIDAYRRSDSF